MTASSHVTSPIRPPRGVAGQFFPLSCRGKPGTVCDGGVGSARPERRTPRLLIRVGQGVSLPSPEIQRGKQQLSVSIKTSALCVLIGNSSTQGLVIEMPVYKRLSGGVCAVRAGYGFVRAVSSQRWTTRPGPSSHLGSFHLVVHWCIKQLHAMLKDV